MNTFDTKSDQEDRLDNSVQSNSKSARSKKHWLWMLLVLLLTGGSITLWRWFSPGQQTPKPVAAQTPPPKPIETTTLTAGRGVRRIQLLGQVESREQATIRSQTAGIVQQILVQPGDRVTTGTTIAILDDADQKLAVAQAKARLAQERSNLARLEVGTRREIIAQRQATVQSAIAREQEAADNLKRTSNLVAQGALSRRVLVEARAALDDARGDRLAAEAQLAEAQAGPTREEIDAQRANVAAALSAVNQAELSLRRTRIRALSDGVVQVRQVSPGDYVQTANPVVTTISGNNLDIFLELPENLSGRIQPGQSVALTARALPQWNGRATITGVVPAAEATSRRQRVRVRLDNPPQGLLPGMAITGNLEIAANTQSFVVSRDTLTQRQNQWLIFTVANGKVQQQKVELVADMGEKVAIYNPQLRAGQSIVLRGGDGLTNGASVKVVNR
ncbi:efflux RND transporter periplasmic adaptor subunit [Iningainema tapete]|uniref:Efflux RND transporter periplasmic adaptor subunit n=1 Tax=Iningainema tapete BLCC-T55 TaxID=2748662 RepID=A0A8J6XJN4_9CYAN|nr:efflux RND transporter periplasmic adaptor subunit [Iningainema tapete]MBD2772744.1 efflux RND transporter periplasmic adaptor subunit [Iningainema tapete BLCC-T55]